MTQVMRGARGGKGQSVIQLNHPFSRFQSINTSCSQSYSVSSQYITSEVMLSCIQLLTSRNFHLLVCCVKMYF